MNLYDEIEKLKAAGYSEQNAQSKLGQDIVLKAIADSGMAQNATIKGGVVMRSISGNARRATQDLDLDFIRYSISDDSIRTFVKKLNCIDGLTIKNAPTVVIVPVAGVSFSVVQFPAVNGLRDGTEIPHRPTLTVQFLPGLFTQLFLRNESGHDHHLPSHGVRVLYHGRRNAASVCSPLTEALPLWYDCSCHPACRVFCMYGDLYRIWPDSGWKHNLCASGRIYL